jgi:hypothetical protein
VNHAGSQREEGCRSRPAARPRPRTLGEIRARRRELVARAAEQREALAVSTAGLAPLFAAGDRAVAVGRSLLSHPFLLAGTGLLLLVLWPRAVVASAARGFALWRGARALGRLAAHRG